MTVLAGVSATRTAAQIVREKRQTTVGAPCFIRYVAIIWGNEADFFADGEFSAQRASKVRYAAPVSMTISAVLQGTLPRKRRFIGILHFVARGPLRYCVD